MKGLVTSFEERERIWKAYAKATAGTPAALAAKTRLSGLIGNTQSQPQSGGVVTPPSSSRSGQQESVTAGTCYSEEATVYGDDGYGYGKIEECDGESLRLYPVEQSSTTSYAPNFSYSPIEDFSSIPPTPGSRPTQSEFGDLASMALVQSSGYIGAYSDYYIDTTMPSASELLPSYPSSTYPSQPVSFADETHHHHRHTLPALQNSEDAAIISGALDMTFFADDQNGDSSTSSSTAATSSCQSPELSSMTRARRHTYAAFPSAPLASSSPITSRRKGAAASGRDSNDVTTLSNTLAVIKAQAFGNVRKTRARTKRTSSSAGAAKAAVEILEARGLSLGIDIAGGVKRRRRGDGFGGRDKALEDC